MPSLSSASTTSHSPRSQTAFVPISFTSPADQETTGCQSRFYQYESKQGRRGGLPVRARYGHDRRQAHIAASVSARDGDPNSPLAGELHLGVVVVHCSRDAEQLRVVHQRSVVADLDPTPDAANRSSAGDAFRSLPVTR